MGTRLGTCLAAGTTRVRSPRQGITGSVAGRISFVVRCAVSAVSVRISSYNFKLPTKLDHTAATASATDLTLSTPCLSACLSPGPGHGSRHRAHAQRPSSPTIVGSNPPPCSILSSLGAEQCLNTRRPSKKYNREYNLNVTEHVGGSRTYSTLFACTYTLRGMGVAQGSGCTRSSTIGFFAKYVRPPPLARGRSAGCRIA